MAHHIEEFEAAAFVLSMKASPARAQLKPAFIVIFGSELDKPGDAQ